MRFERNMNLIGGIVLSVLALLVLLRSYQAYQSGVWIDLRISNRGSLSPGQGALFGLLVLGFGCAVIKISWPKPDVPEKRDPGEK